MDFVCNFASNVPLLLKFLDSIDILESLSLLDVFVHFVTPCLVEKEPLVSPPLGLGLSFILGGRLC